MIKLSVIVPIYNVEKQIERCIESILKQKMKDIQIILINDGSTDKSGKIAKKYADKYSNIIYIEKENGGLSEARNTGIKYATGEYITFIDSDDYISDNLYEDIEKYLDKKYDMIKIKINIVDENGKILSKNETEYFENLTGEEAFELLYKRDKMTEVAWGYIYRRNFFNENKFEFTKNKYHEDFGLIPIILLKAQKVASLDILGYNYVQTPKSITRGNDKIKYQRALDLLYFYDNMIEKIKNYNISNYSKENIKIYYSNCIILEVQNLNGEEKRDYIKQIKERKIINNIKPRNLKQFFKNIILHININLYLKIR